MNKKKKLWDIAESLLIPGRMPNMHVYYFKFDDKEKITIYHRKGFCFELEREYLYESENGDKQFNYSLYEHWSKLGTDKTSELIKKEL